MKKVKKGKKNKFSNIDELCIIKRFHRVGNKDVPRLFYKNAMFVRYKKNRHLKRDDCYVDIYRCKTYSEMKYREKEKCNATIWERLLKRGEKLFEPDGFYLVKKGEHVCQMSDHSKCSADLQIPLLKNYVPQNIVLRNVVDKMVDRIQDQIIGEKTVTLSDSDGVSSDYNFPPNVPLDYIVPEIPQEETDESLDEGKISEREIEEDGILDQNSVNFLNEDLDIEDEDRITINYNDDKEDILGVEFDDELQDAIFLKEKEPELKRKMPEMKPRKRLKRSRDPYQDLELEKERDFSVSFTVNSVTMQQAQQNTGDWNNSFNKILAAAKKMEIFAVLPPKGSTLGYDYIEVFFSFLSIDFKIIPLMFSPHLSSSNMTVFFGQNEAQLQCVNLTRNSNSIDDKIKPLYGDSVFSLCKYRSQLYCLVKNPPNKEGFVNVSIRYMPMGEKKLIRHSLENSFEYVDKEKSKKEEKLLDVDIEKDEEDNRPYDIYSDLMGPNDVNDDNRSEGAESDNFNNVNFFDMFLLKLFNSKNVEYNEKKKIKTFRFQKIKPSRLKRVVREFSTRHDACGYDLVVHCIARGMTWLIEILLNDSSGFVGRRVDNFGNNYYHWATLYERKEVIELLKKNLVVGIDEKNDFGFLPKEFILNNLNDSKKQKKKKNQKIEKKKLKMEHVEEEEEVNSDVSVEEDDDSDKDEGKEFEKNEWKVKEVSTKKDFLRSRSDRIAQYLTKIMAKRISCGYIYLLTSIFAIFVIAYLTARHYHLKNALLKAKNENFILRKDMNMMEMRYLLSTNYSNRLEEERNAMLDNLQKQNEQNNQKKGRVFENIEEKGDHYGRMLSDMEEKNILLRNENIAVTKRMQLLEWKNITMSKEISRLRKKKQSYKTKNEGLIKSLRQLEIENAVLQIENERSREYIDDLKDMGLAIIFTVVFLAVVMYFAYTTKGRKNLTGNEIENSTPGGDEVLVN